MQLIKRYKALSLPVKAAIWFTSVNFITKGINFITVPIFTKFLSTSEYGKVSIFLTYQGILINFATFEMYSGAYIRGMLRYKENVSLFTWSEQLLSTIITIIVFIISIPVMPWIIANAQINYHIYILMYCYFMVFPAYQCWVSKKRFDYNYKPVIISAVMYSVLSIIIPLVAVMKLNPTSSVRISFMLFTETTICLPFYLYNIHFRQLISNRKTVLKQWKFLILFQTPSVVHALSYIILSSMDRIMIGKMAGNAETGIYSLATTIASVITILSISANQVLKPWRYQKMEKHNYKIIRSTSNVLLVAFGVAIILWVLVAPDIIHLLFPTDYYQAIWVIPPVSISVFFVFLYSMFVDIEEYYYKTKYTMYATTISAVANIIMNYFGIKLWGYIACAYTTLICYILLAILHLFWSNKASNNHGIHINQIFNIKYICLLSFFLTIGGLLFILTYENQLVRYFFFLLVIILCLLNKNKMGLIFKDIKKS